METMQLVKEEQKYDDQATVTIRLAYYEKLKNFYDNNDGDRQGENILMYPSMRIMKDMLDAYKKYCNEHDLVLVFSTPATSRVMTKDEWAKSPDNYLNQK